MALINSHIFVILAVFPTAFASAPSCPYQLFVCIMFDFSFRKHLIRVRRRRLLIMNLSRVDGFLHSYGFIFRGSGL